MLLKADRAAHCVYLCRDTSCHACVLTLMRHRRVMSLLMGIFVGAVFYNVGLDISGGGGRRVCVCSCARMLV